jgi:hypothetical protein
MDNIIYVRPDVQNSDTNFFAAQRIVRNMSLLFEIQNACLTEDKLVGDELDFVRNNIKLDLVGPADFKVGDISYQIFSRYELAQNASKDVQPIIIGTDSLVKTNGVYFFKEGVAKLVLKMMITGMTLSTKSKI